MNVKKIGVVLLAVALVAGMAGCFTPFRMQYQLTLSSTEGGEVTTPGEGTFTYWGGTVVNLVAEADEGYCFVNWTGDAYACNIADINAASTSITINNDYSIIANFAPEIYENLEIWDWYGLDAVRDNLSENYILMNDLDLTTIGYAELASPTANAGKGWEPIGTFYDEFTGTFNGQGYEICNLFINRPNEYYIGLFGYVIEGVIKNLGVGNVDVTGYVDVGGLVGACNGTVSNSYSRGNVTGGAYIGGLIGGNAGIVNKSYSTGNVTGLGCVGGLVSFNNQVGTIGNSYSSANVTGEQDIGGLVGKNDGTVSDSYSIGSVTGTEAVGGLVGENDGTVINSFWNTETSGQTTSAGGTCKNTTEMQDITTFSGVSWDIVAVVNLEIHNPSYIWNIVDDDTYPFLSWQPIS